MGGSKGGSTQSSSNQSGVSFTNLPDWLTSAAQGAVAQGQTLSQQPYAPYGGQMVAGTPAATQQAYQQYGALQGAAAPAYAASEAAYQGLLPSAAPLTAAGLNQNASSLYGNFQTNVLNPSASLLGNYLGQAGPATAGGVAANAQTLMNPYEQSVISPLLTTAAQQLAQQEQGIGAQAANVGAYGGTRQGVQEGVAQAQSILGTENTLGNLLTSGYNAALQPAYGLASGAAQQGLTAEQTLAQQALQGYTGYGQAAQQAGTMGTTNLQAGLNAAAGLPSVATTAQGQAATEAGLLAQNVGAPQQAQQQALLNAQLGQYYAGQQYPYQQLDTLLSSITGVPYGTSQYTYGQGTGTQQTNPGLLNEITGGIGALTSIGGMSLGGGQTVAGSLLALA